MVKPRVVVIAGPNGAGKSVAAPFLLRKGLRVKEFVNADQIAAGLSAYAPETVAFEAGRVMLRRLRTLAEQRASFAFESTLSSRSFAPFLAGLKQQGYAVEIIYISLPTPQLALQRVALRVAQGGHAIPKADVERRYFRSLKNAFELYLPLVDSAVFFDNASGKLVRIASITKLAAGQRLRVKDEQAWQSLKHLASLAR